MSTAKTDVPDRQVAYLLRDSPASWRQRVQIGSITVAIAMVFGIVPLTGVFLRLPLVLAETLTGPIMEAYPWLLFLVGTWILASPEPQAASRTWGLRRSIRILVAPIAIYVLARTILEPAFIPSAFFFTADSLLIALAGFYVARVAERIPKPTLATEARWAFSILAVVSLLVGIDAAFFAISRVTLGGLEQLEFLDDLPSRVWAVFGALIFADYACKGWVIAILARLQMACAQGTAEDATPNRGKGEVMTGQVPSDDLGGHLPNTQPSTCWVALSALGTVIISNLVLVVTISIYLFTGRPDPHGWDAIIFAPGFYFGAISSLIGIVLSAIALVRIRVRPQLRGTKLAFATLLLSLLGPLVWYGVLAIPLRDIKHWLWA